MLDALSVLRLPHSFIPCTPPLAAEPAAGDGEAEGTPAGTAGDSTPEPDSVAQPGMRELPLSRHGDDWGTDLVRRDMEFEFTHFYVVDSNACRCVICLEWKGGV